MNASASSVTAPEQAPARMRVQPERAGGRSPASTYVSFSSSSPSTTTTTRRQCIPLSASPTLTNPSFASSASVNGPPVRPPRPPDLAVARSQPASVLLCHAARRARGAAPAPIRPAGAQGTLCRVCEEVPERAERAGRIGEREEGRCGRVRLPRLLAGSGQVLEARPGGLGDRFGPGASRRVLIRKTSH